MRTFLVVLLPFVNLLKYKMMTALIKNVKCDYSVGEHKIALAIFKLNMALSDKYI